MSINIRRFDPRSAEYGHEGTILSSGVLPEAMSAPFYHAYGYLLKNGSMAGHTHETDEIYIVLSGTGYVILDGKNKAVNAGDVIAIPAGRWHTMLCTDKDEQPFLWAAFWWNKLHSENMSKGESDDIHTLRFDKDKAYKAHQDTILADIVVPPVVKTPFDHAYGYLENNNSMEMHSHSAQELYIVYSGKGYVTIGDERQEVSQGDAIEIPSNKMHSMTAQEDGAFLWAAFWWD